MRVMIAGLTEKEAKRLLDGLEGIGKPGGVLEDWSLLEEAVQQARPDVVAIYLGRRPTKALEMVTRVRALYPGTRFVALAEREEEGLVNLVSQAGCADIALMQLGARDLRRALLIIQQRVGSEPSAEGTVFAFLGAKGGVGTTTVAINVAGEIAAETDLRVIIVDLHTYLGDVAALLDVTPSPTALWFLTRANPSVDWARSMPEHRSGMRVLGLDGDLTEADRITAQQVVNLIDRLREHHDIVILDLGSNLTEVSLAGLSSADQRLIVLTEELPAVLGARRRLFTMRGLDFEPPIATAVLNRFHNSSKVDREAVEGALGVSLSGVVTNAYKDVHGAMEQAKLVREAAPRSVAAEDISKLAQALVGDDAQERNKSKNFFQRLWGR